MDKWGAATVICRRLGACVAEAVFPFRCLACGVLFRPGRANDEAAAGDGQPLGTPSPGRVFRQVCGRLLCPDCLSAVRPVASPICPRCGLVFGSRQGSDHLCGECLAAEKHFDTARAFGVYDGSLMALIHQLKYRGRTRLAAVMGRLLSAAFVRHFDGRVPDIVAPVPLHAGRFRKRGFNQAYLLAAHLDIRAAEDAAGRPAPRLERELLLRRRATRPQTGLRRGQRLANIKNAFAAAGVNGKRILLVDDVLTTGATANECARVLKAAGARRVDVLTLARGI